MTEQERDDQIKKIKKEIEKCQRELSNIIETYNIEHAKFLDMYDNQLNIGDIVIISKNNIPHKGIILKLKGNHHEGWGQCEVEYEIVKRNLQENKPESISKNKALVWAWEVIRIR